MAIATFIADGGFPSEIWVNVEITHILNEKSFVYDYGGAGDCRAANKSLYFQVLR